MEQVRVDQVKGIVYASSSESSDDEDELHATPKSTREYADAAARRNLRSFNSVTSLRSLTGSFVRGRRGDEKAAATVRMLSLNIFIRPPGVKANADDYKDERLADLQSIFLPGYLFVIATYKSSDIISHDL